MRRNRIKGAIYGFAIGDAMGATTEFMEKNEVHQKYDKVTDIIGGGWLSLEAGEVTDDTQMTLCVAEACFENNFEEACCKNFLEWYQTDPKDVGAACKSVIAAMNVEKVVDPLEWRKTSLGLQANRGSSYGNGSLMRCLVPCLLGDREKAINQGSLTHFNELCSELITDYYHGIQRALEGQKIGGKFSHKPPTGHVSNTFNNVGYWFQNSNTFREAIENAVNDGGDADTIAAILGGLAGAYCGFEEIPPEWVKQLSPSVREQLDWVVERIVKESNNVGS